MVATYFLLLCTTLAGHHLSCHLLCQLHPNEEPINSILRQRVASTEHIFIFHQIHVSKTAQEVSVYIATETNCVSATSSITDWAGLGCYDSIP